MTLESPNLARTGERKQERELCSRCHRVTPQSCLCSALPAAKLPSLSHTIVVILQHPHEFQHKTNRSVPLLDLCLPLELCVGRRLGDQIPDKVQAWLRPPHLPILIFPRLPEERNDVSKKVFNLSEIQDKISEWRQKGRTLTEKEATTTADTPKVVLLVLDATWKYAKEMHRANGINYPSHMLRMSLDGEADLPSDFQPRRFELRTTPQTHESSGWMSTAECVSWIVSKLENQASIYEATIQVLDAAVLQHRSFIAENMKKRDGTSEEPRSTKKRRGGLCKQDDR